MNPLDDILQPENIGINKPTATESKKRLADLKSLLQSDPVQLDTESLISTAGDFPPNNDNIKYIDYDEKKVELNDVASGVINNIFLTFIKEDNRTKRINDMIDKDIKIYSRLLLLVDISESNMIKLQESIDGGDMSKDMFDSVNKAQQEFRANMNAAEQHLIKVEKYWKSYSEIYGIESTEDKIMQNVTEESGEKTHIVAMTDIIDKLQEIRDKERDDLNDNKKRRD